MMFDKKLDIRDILTTRGKISFIVLKHEIPLIRSASYKLLSLFEIQLNYVHQIPEVEIRGRKDNFLYASLKDKKLTLYSGYQWDGASGIAIDSEKVILPSLIHDALAQLAREVEGFDSHFYESNLEFKELLIEQGVSAFRATYMYHAVQLFGRKYMSFKGGKNDR